TFLFHILAIEFSGMAGISPDRPSIQQEGAPDMPVETMRREWRKLIVASSQLNRQTVFILVSAAVLLVIQFNFGSRTTFRTHFASFFVEEWRGVLSWGWWFTMQGITGFVVPVLILTVLFKR